MAQFDRERLDALVADGWLKSQRHPHADLWIYNYTEKTQFANYWIPETLVCRGLILDESGGVVARPFEKFFSYETAQAANLPAEPFTVTEKIDGSLGILYYLEAEPAIATRGSFTSKQAVQGTMMIRDCDIDRVDGVTMLFEIVYRANRIVVDYGDRRDLTLLAAICNQTGKDKPLPRYSGEVVNSYDYRDLNTLASLEEPNQEGFVVAFESGLRVKVKFAEYLRLHKIVTGVNARMIWESMQGGDDLDTLLAGLPEEIYDWMTATRQSIQRAYDRQLEQAREAFGARPRDADRKGLAAYFLSTDANPAVLFRMLDGRPTEDLIWKSVRPEPETPSKRQVGIAGL